MRPGFKPFVRDKRKLREATDEIICPHCGKRGKSMGQMKRWHFDNCKEKK